MSSERLLAPIRGSGEDWAWCAWCFVSPGLAGETRRSVSDDAEGVLGECVLG
jgi:hypothetical protein